MADATPAFVVPTDARDGAATRLETDIPARLDCLPWGRFHTLVIAALGITWILDGLEVTLAGSVSGALKASPALRLTDAEIGLSASLYVAGAVTGGLFFGWLTDRFGRRRLFNVTLGLYLLATAATAFSTDFWTFALFRMLTGAGIGGEYVAINSAIQELIPARYRGRTDLLVNGSFWIGAALGAGGAVVLLEPGRFAPDLGWRLAFGIGAALGLVILYLRRFIPESPRWLMTHGRVAEAERIMAAIEQRCGATRAPDAARIAFVHRRIGLLDVARTLFRTYPQRSLYALVLMASQAFFYNAIFFTYALVLGRFFAVPAEAIGLYILPFAVGNFLGPLVLGRTLRRRRPQAHDRLHLCGFGAAARRDRGALRRRSARGDRPDDRMVGRLLLRVGRGELGLPHRRRELPARDARARHRRLLRPRHRARRHRRPVAVRRPHRHRRAGGDRLGLRARRGSDADRRRGRAPARRGSRAPLARGRRPAAVLRGLKAYGPFRLTSACAALTSTLTCSVSSALISLNPAVVFTE